MSDTSQGGWDSGPEGYGPGFGSGGFAAPDGGFVPPSSDAPPTQAAMPVPPQYPQGSYPPPNYPPSNYPPSNYPQGYAPQLYPGGYYGPPMLRQQTSGMAVTGMVMGILSLVLFWASLLGPLLALLGIVFSSVGLSQSSKPGFTGKGMAIAGLVCSLISMAFWVLLAIAVASLLA
ncbi:hypothetical protein ABH920_007032 [Catenulispora sp. EB89]|uniref:DUF4190 domain-containing protein n=1 Tax=Catenulispora sp. EB89 TaxID=3156257 RepID=UPI0035175E9C